MLTADKKTIRKINFLSALPYVCAGVGLVVFVLLGIFLPEHGEAFLWGKACTWWAGGIVLAVACFLLVNRFTEEAILKIVVDLLPDDDDDDELYSEDDADLYEDEE